MEKHIGTFLAVRRAAGMRAAAGQLHLSQPAVSSRIRELESQLEVQLFERVGRGLRLTPAGERLAAEAPALLAAQAAVVERVRGEGARLVLRLATIDAASIYVLPRVYRDFRAAHPEVQIRVQVVDSRSVVRALRALDVDLGILVASTPPPGLRCTPFFEEELVCVGPAEGPAPGGARLDLERLAALPLVLYPRGSTTRALIDAVFAARGLEPNVVMETASPEAMRRLAEVGVGFALLPEPLVRDEIASGRLRTSRARDARFTRRLVIAVRRQRDLPRAARLFLAQLEQSRPALEPRPSPESARPAPESGPRRRRRTRHG